LLLVINKFIHANNNILIFIVIINNFVINKYIYKASDYVPKEIKS